VKSSLANVKTYASTVGKAVLIAILAFLAWRIYLYDFPDAKRVYGSLAPLSLYAAVVGIWAVINGRWMAAFGFAILSITLLRSISKAKADYVSSALDASDFRNINVTDFWTTVSQYPAVMFRVAALICATVLLCFAILRLWRAKSLVTRLAGLVLFSGSAFLAHQQLKTPPDHEVLGAQASLIAFVQSFYVQAVDINSDAQERVSPSFSCPQDPKNILLVLQESTFRPEALGKNLSGTLNAFFNEGELAGPLKVHVFGGFTHLSDFAVQTGVPHTVLKGDRMYTSSTLPGRLNHTLAQILKGCGYETTVIHPITRSYFNARNWYRSVGFDQVLSSEDLGHDPASFWHVPDKVFLDAARDVAQRAAASTGKPQFIYVLTIAQHGPHDATGDPQAEFMKRLESSAAAYVELMRALEPKTSTERPWIAAWFGDHRPHLIEAADVSKRYITWFNLRTLPAAAAVQPAQEAQAPALDISFLNSVILDRAGVRNSPSHTHAKQMMRTCTDNYLNCPTEKIKAHHDLLRVSGAFAPPSP
jgi:Sulfatase